MSGMIVFDLHMMGIDGTEIARGHSTFPHSTCSAKWSILLKLHQKFSPNSIGHAWGTIKIYKKEAPVMGLAKFSQTAQCLSCKDIVLSGKIPLITSNLPSLCMGSMM